MKPKNCVEQRNSSLLTKDENDKIIALLGYRCQALATTVVQLFTTDGPDGTEWEKKYAGVLCLVRDANRRSYFFRLFCLIRSQLVWEHEVYNSMEYTAPMPYLHTFEAEECVVAFNFANEAEATHMKDVLHEKLKAKEEKRLERRARAGGITNSRHSLKAAPPRPPSGLSNSSSTISNGFPSPVQSPNIHPTPPSSNRNNFTRRPKRRVTGKITKADIGMPQGFIHISHVGWDPDTGFDLSNLQDPKLQEFFTRAGVSESHLQDRSTREFIYAFIEKHGGLDAVKEDMNVSQILPDPQHPPPVPARIVHPLPTSSAPMVRSAPPPPPSKSRNNVTLPSPPPPPPPPIQTIPSRMQDNLGDRSPFSNCMAPTPPPPPPPPPPSLPTSLPVVDSESSSSTTEVIPDTHSALMNAIRCGTTLKHVDTESKKNSAILFSNVDDSRGELLNQIRQGVELKSVQQPAKPEIAQFDGLAGALARALHERSKAIYGDDSSASESDDDYDDDEWED